MNRCHLRIKDRSRIRNFDVDGLSDREIAQPAH